ncbi:CLUMA_CG008955, isoform A [Clunio marinus]|uniref:CLUMA_CG008955, isoform A n=1 Tax=Clunio marinus TaxID=568069 RepID=A0A1J1I945_9DIPT|nr:CLUMA_CG008955, isoform A [Clunio marinus]
MGGQCPVWLVSALFILTLANVEGELTPPYFNLAEGRKISASSTCGVDIDGPELYCKLVGSHTDDQQNKTLFDYHDDHFHTQDLSRQGHVVIQGQQCDYCLPDSHPVENAIDGSEKWWQSPPLSRGMKFNEVNLTIDFGQTSSIVN